MRFCQRAGMINQKTKSSMNNCLTNQMGHELDRRIESRLEWNELITGEIMALRALERVGDENGNYVPVMIEEEIQRRRSFLAELLSEF